MFRRWLLLLAFFLLAIPQSSVLALATTFTTPTTISVSDTTYDNQDVIVDGTTVTILGSHIFSNFIVRNSGIVTTNTELKLDLTAARIEIDAT